MNCGAFEDAIYQSGLKSVMIQTIQVKIIAVFFMFWPQLLNYCYFNNIDPIRKSCPQNTQPY